MADIGAKNIDVNCVPIQIGFPVEVASDRGERGNGTLEGLQPETAGEYTSGTRGRSFSIYC